VLCLVGMLWYNRVFADDTPKANRKAWKVMLGIYIFIAVVGIYFLSASLFFDPQIQWKTFIQALIMLGLGGGGTWLSLSSKG